MGQPMYICQNCKKAPATIHLTDIHDNVKKEVHLCENCAAEQGFSFKGAANLPHLLGLAAKKAIIASSKQKLATPTEDPVCPKCGLRWSQFGDRGRLGCPEDYEAFADKMQMLISNQILPHPRGDESLHLGKKPGPKSEEDELDQRIRGLEKRLRQAVAEENYESAAALKSELDELRKEKAGRGAS